MLKFSKFIKSIKSKALNLFRRKNKNEKAPDTYVATPENYGATIELSSGIQDDWLHLSKQEVQRDIEIQNDWQNLSKEEVAGAVAADKQRAESITEEFLTKKAAYRLAVPVSKDPDAAYTQQNRLRDMGYTKESLGSTVLENKGLYIYGLVHEQENNPINIVCRGTADDASIIRDLDPMGPGYSTFKQHSSELLNQIAQLVARYPHRKIHVCGHSFGGALAQIIGAAILKARANEADLRFDSLPGINFSVFQSAWVHDELIAEATDSVKAIRQKTPGFTVDFKAHIKQGDFVSRTGGTLFGDVGPEVAQVTLDMRALDKPILRLIDVVTIASAVATITSTGLIVAEPVLACASVVAVTASTTLQRYTQNRLEAHVDRFSPCADQLDFDTAAHDKSLETGVYGVYSNNFAEDRKKIEHIFSKNDLKHIPYHNACSKALYSIFQEVSSEEVINVLATAGILIKTVPVLMSCNSAKVCEHVEEAFNKFKDIKQNFNERGRTERPIHTPA